MHHKRVVQEKNRLITDIKRLKVRPLVGGLDSSLVDRAPRPIFLGGRVVFPAFVL
jgi:hypothetical protein